MTDWPIGRGGDWWLCTGCGGIYPCIASSVYFTIRLCNKYSFTCVSSPALSTYKRLRNALPIVISVNQIEQMEGIKQMKEMTKKEPEQATRSWTYHPSNLKSNILSSYLSQAGKGILMCCEMCCVAYRSLEFSEGAETAQNRRHDRLMQHGRDAGMWWGLFTSFCINIWGDLLLGRNRAILEVLG